MNFFKNTFISTLLSLSFISLQAFAESPVPLVPTMILESCDGKHMKATGNCVPVGTALPAPKTGGDTPRDFGPPPKKVVLPPVQFPIGQECDEATGICKLIYDTPTGDLWPLPTPTEYKCDHGHAEDGSCAKDVPRPIYPIKPLLKCAQGYISHDGEICVKNDNPFCDENGVCFVIDCAPGYVLNGKNCIPIDMPPCAISGACTTGPSGGTSVSEPTLPAMLLTLLGLGFWLRRRK